MNALRIIESELQTLGYRSDAIIRDYKFADVLSVQGDLRHVDIAAFTQVPESYRSAAFGVVSGVDEMAAVAARRSLGAPILFSIGGTGIGVWRVGAEGAPHLLERVGIDAIPELFRRNAERWRPQSVHRAKSLGHTTPAYQLDFVDLGLIPAIEREVEVKLDRLLQGVIGQLVTGLGERQEEAAFRVTFRLLAAKILLDRGHPAAADWHGATADHILAGIKNYYKLADVGGNETLVPPQSVSIAWGLLREAINFRNISSDSLAFIYENTLVTADTRKRFGTHSTPRQVAEYVVGQLNLAQFDLDTIRVYEPFTGAGSFLVAALRNLRDVLPETWTDRQRHAFLVSRIQGAEIDSFACEVAALSLILADYPNANGWTITPTDLFRPAALVQELSRSTVVLCNPPWEDFTPVERAEYVDAAEKSFSKPMMVLQTILDAKPLAIGFVLPQGFLRQKQYASLRQQVANLYGRIELTELPDRIFQRAGLEGAVLVATGRLSAATSRTKLVSATVDDSGREAFLATGRVSTERVGDRFVSSGQLWMGELDELWQHLKRAGRLGDVAEVYRGLKWWKQDKGVSATERPGFVPGVFRPSDSLRQFEIGNSVFLNSNPADAMFPGPLTRAWDRPKVLTNVARLSRGPWRLAAAYDDSGLVASQAFFGVWPMTDALTPAVLEGVLNGPLANAFLAEHASNQHFTNELLLQLPLPGLQGLDGIANAVKRYRDALQISRANMLRTSDDDARLSALLLDVDAQVLKAYDLPPRIERRLLEFFRGHEGERRVSHAFEGWIPLDFTACIPLHEYLGPLVEQNRGAWVLDAFQPAPEDEAKAIERFIH